MKEFYEWLDSHLNFEKKPQKDFFWLDTMKYLVKEFGHPEKASPCVHVAGSKGKGSVSRMIASILNEKGLKTGLYGSPHIIDFNERITNCGDFFEEQVYEKVQKLMLDKIPVLENSDFLRDRNLTWFELVTLYSFLCFREAKCDYSVYEVGLGGRLDSTNVIVPQVSVINSIELEHVEFLGDTLEKIAGEKAGIIKPGVPVVVGWQKKNVMDVFRKAAETNGCKLFEVENLVKLTNVSYKYNKTNEWSVVKSSDYPSFGMEITMESPLFSDRLTVVLKMSGLVQAQNACVAAVTAKILFPEIQDQVIARGLEKASLPGRFEFLCDRDYPFGVVLDGAHTVNSIRNTVDTFSCLRKAASFGDGATLVFSCASDKDVEDMARLFVPAPDGRFVFDQIFITRPGNVKACNLERIKSAFDCAGLKYFSDSDYNLVIKKALESAGQKKEPVLITGSFYLLAEAKRIIEECR